MRMSDGVSFGIDLSKNDVDVKELKRRMKKKKGLGNFNKEFDRFFDYFMNKKLNDIEKGISKWGDVLVWL